MSHPSRAEIARAELIAKYDLAGCPLTQDVLLTHARLTAERKRRADRRAARFPADDIEVELEDAIRSIAFELVAEPAFEALGNYGLRPAAKGFRATTPGDRLHLVAALGYAIVADLIFSIRDEGYEVNIKNITVMLIDELYQYRSAKDREALSERALTTFIELNKTRNPDADKFLDARYDFVRYYLKRCAEDRDDPAELRRVAGVMFRNFLRIAPSAI